MEVNCVLAVCGKEMTAWCLSKQPLEPTQVSNKKLQPLKYCGVGPDQKKPSLVYSNLGLLLPAISSRLSCSTNQSWWQEVAISQQTAGCYLCVWWWLPCLISPALPMGLGGSRRFAREARELNPLICCICCSVCCHPRCSYFVYKSEDMEL